MSRLKILQIVLRVLVGILSLGMIYWYLISRIMSFGSIVGVLIFSVIILFVVFFEKFVALANKIKKNRLGKIFLEITKILAAVFALYVVAVMGSMVYAAHRPTDDHATVVVLGCQVRGTQPSHMLRMRLDAAYDYLKEHPAAKCIVSGGQGQNEEISEAQCMYEYLTQKGIAAERIYQEDKSENTKENITFSQEIIQKENLEPKMAIVTDWYHEMRAAIIAQRLGYSCGSVPADTPDYLTANFVTREIFAVAHEIIFKG